jgi:surface antigen
VTHSGHAGSPVGDGALPTRRELRAQRDAAASAPSASVPSASAASAAGATPAVPVPEAPMTVSADLAVVVEAAPSASTAPDLPTYVLPARVPGRHTPPAAAAASVTRRAGRSRKPLAKMVTLIAIPAIFLTTALPAYAFAPQGDATSITAAPVREVQELTVAAAAAAVSIPADGFSSTSQAEIDEVEAGIRAELSRKAAEAARSSAAGYASYGIRAEGDDYPWMNSAIESNGGGLSPLGYYYRECVDFVAWRLNRDAGANGSPWKWTWGNLTPGGGNGSAWASNWASKGRATGKTPVVGAVATFTYNHVAYVQSVPGDGTVVLEEYNWMGSHAYHTRTVPISAVSLFLYPPS